MYEYHQSYVLNDSMSAVGVVVKTRIRRGALVRLWRIYCSTYPQIIYVYINLVNKSAPRIYACEPIPDDLFIYFCVRPHDAHKPFCMSEN